MLLGTPTMNNLVLDTHVFIWYLTGDTTLPVKSRQLINQHLTKANVYISAISCWEMAMLEQKKRIVLTEPCLQWIHEGLQGSGIQVLELTPQICVESCALPGNLHGDPADRMIIASARTTHSQLLTRDQSIIAYGKKNHVQVVEV